MPARRSVRAQRGMAVIAALVIVALVATIAAAIALRESAALRLARDSRLRAGALDLARDGAAQAIARLDADARSQAATVRDGPWQVPWRIATRGDGPEATLDLRLEDAQARFNLRNLVRDDVVDADEVAGFARLCELRHVPPAPCEGIVARILASVPHAAATDAPPLRLGTARQPLPRDVDDLAGVPGLDAAMRARLRPVVAILPENTWTNGNTTSAEVLVAAIPGVTLEQARQVLRERDQGRWFVNRGDFANRLRLPDLPLAQVRIGIGSYWFELHGTADIDGHQVPVRALIRRAIQAPGAPRLMWLQVGA